MSENRNLKIYSILSISLFMAILILPTTIWGIGKLLPGKPINALNYDLGENRNMAAFPSQSSSASFLILPKDLQMDPTWPLHQTFIGSDVQQRLTWFICIQLRIPNNMNLIGTAYLWSNVWLWPSPP